MLNLISFFTVLSAFSPLAHAEADVTILDRFRTIYTPIYQAAGLEFDLAYLPEVATPTLRAKWLEEGSKVARVEVSQSFLEISYIDNDMATLGICHEIGHHLAGKVRYEPQADYYATLKCTRLMFRGDDNERIVEELRPDITAQKICMNAWRERAEQLVCMRTLVASERMAVRHITPNARAFAYSGPDPSLSGRDRTVVELTIARYPLPQCRLDTYVAGATCNRSADAPPSFENELENICDPRNGDKIGNRPRCWYSPKG